MTQLNRPSQFFIALSFLLSISLTILTQPVAAQSTNSVVAWGSNRDGQLNVPEGLHNVKALAAGHSFSLALKNDGTVVAWGSNTFGEMNVPAGLSGVTAIAAGNSFCLALKSDGTVVAWGAMNVPVGLRDVKAIAAGFGHALALKKDGTVVAWGQNNYGQTNIPAGVGGVIAIAAGDYHSLAVRYDGIVFEWGKYDSRKDLPSPTIVAAGSTHSLALMEYGSVFSWGSDIRSTTVISGVKAIAAGALHSLALKNDGTVYAWGNNTYGQTNVPVELRSVTAIAAGATHSLAFGNTPPTITVNSPSQITGTASNNVQLATVKDAQEVEELLDVSATPLSGFGVSLTGMRVDSKGNLTANVQTVCGATPSAFTLRATDRSGLFSEAKLTINVGPNTSFTNGPASVSGAHVTFSFIGANNCAISSFECKLDGGGWTASTGSQSYSNLANGTHTFRVRAKDAAGNVDPTPAIYTWQVFAASCGTTVLPLTLAQPKIGVAYNQSLAATPSGNYTFSLLSGTLPPGLQIIQIPSVIGPWLSWLTGTPTTRGTYTFALKAKKNNSSCEGARMYTITVQ